MTADHIRNASWGRDSGYPTIDLEAEKVAQLADLSENLKLIAYYLQIIGARIL